MHVGKKLLFVLAAAIVAAAAIAGSLSTSGGKAATKATRVAVVADIGSLNDKGFNTLSGLGLKRAEKQLGVDGRIYATQTAADRQPNLDVGGPGGYPLVFGVGVLFAFGPLPTVAAAFPTTKFAGIDVAQGDMCGGTGAARVQERRDSERPRHPVRRAGGGLSRRQHRGARDEARASQRHLGNRREQGARDRPLHRRLQVLRAAGEQEHQGPRQLRERPDVRRPDEVQGDGAGADRPPLARDLPVAGQCGLGALDAAKSAGIWGIGVDADQYFLGSHMLTSATKRVDQAVFDTIKNYQADPSGFKGGIEKQYNLKNDGVGYGRLSPKLPASARKQFTASTNALEQLIIKGKVTPPKA